MRARSGFALAAAASLVLGACSDPAPAPQAPPGAMESFADKQAQDTATDKDARIEAARVREAGKAADARQKVQAAEGIERFERAEKAAEQAMDRNAANNAR